VEQEKAELEQAYEELEQAAVQLQQYNVNLKQENAELIEDIDKGSAIAKVQEPLALHHFPTKSHDTFYSGNHDPCLKRSIFPHEVKSFTINLMAVNATYKRVSANSLLQSLWCAGISLLLFTAEPSNASKYPHARTLV